MSNNSNKGVDVLAVLARVSQQVCDLSFYAERQRENRGCEDAAEALKSSDPWPNLDEVRAAVAELLAASAALVMHSDGRAYFNSGSDADRFRAALAPFKATQT